MTKQKTYYLSSKMTGRKEKDWRGDFLLKEDELSRLNGWDIINPANFTPEVENPQWQDYIPKIFKFSVTTQMGFTCLGNGGVVVVHGSSCFQQLGQIRKSL